MLTEALFEEFSVGIRSGFVILFLACHVDTSMQAEAARQAAHYRKETSPPWSLKTSTAHIHDLGIPTVLEHLLGE